MADFIGEDLSGSRFERANLAGSRFERVDLSGAEFRALDLVGTRFRVVTLQSTARPTNRRARVLVDLIGGMNNP